MASRNNTGIIRTGGGPRREKAFHRIIVRQGEAFADFVGLSLDDKWFRAFLPHAKPNVKISDIKQEEGFTLTNVLLVATGLSATGLSMAEYHAFFGTATHVQENPGATVEKRLSVDFWASRLTAALGVGISAATVSRMITSHTALGNGYILTDAGRAMLSRLQWPPLPAGGLGAYTGPPAPAHGGSVAAPSPASSPVVTKVARPPRSPTVKTPPPPPSMGITPRGIRPARKAAAGAAAAISRELELESQLSSPAESPAGSPRAPPCPAHSGGGMMMEDHGAFTWLAPPAPFQPLFAVPPPAPPAPPALGLPPWSKGEEDLEPTTSLEDDAAAGPLLYAGSTLWDGPTDVGDDGSRPPRATRITTGYAAAWGGPHLVGFCPPRMESAGAAGHVAALAALERCGGVTQSPTRWHSPVREPALDDGATSAAWADFITPPSEGCINA